MDYSEMDDYTDEDRQGTHMEAGDMIDLYGLDFAIKELKNQGTAEAADEAKKLERIKELASVNKRDAIHKLALSTGMRQF